MVSRLKRQRRADPHVTSLTRMRDEIKERRAYSFELPESKAKREPAYSEFDPAFNRWCWIRERLRTEAMPTRERECLQRLETLLAKRLGLEE